MSRTFALARRESVTRQPVQNNFMSIGRPSIYSPELAEEICQLIAEGHPLTEICKKSHMPDYRTVLRWRAKIQDFSQMYALAREDQADTLADEILAIADDVSGDWSSTQDGETLNSEHVQRSRLRIDSRKWLAGKMKPKVYGDKTIHAGPDGETPATFTLNITRRDSDI